MKLAIGCDHGGFELKEEVVKFLKTVPNMQVEDCGVASKDSVDYPDYGQEGVGGRERPAPPTAAS